jgi:hypothetical protein
MEIISKDENEERIWNNRGNILLLNVNPLYACVTAWARIMNG